MIIPAKEVVDRSAKILCFRRKRWRALIEDRLVPLAVDGKIVVHLRLLGREFLDEQADTCHKMAARLYAKGHVIAEHLYGDT